MARGWKVNITPTERIARIGVGGLGALAGVVLLTSASGVLPIVLEPLLVVAGLDPSPALSGTARCTPGSATCRAH